MERQYMYDLILKVFYSYLQENPSNMDISY